MLKAVGITSNIIEDKLSDETTRLLSSHFGRRLEPEDANHLLEENKKTFEIIRVCELACREVSCTATATFFVEERVQSILKLLGDVRHVAPRPGTLQNSCL